MGTRGPAQTNKKTLQKRGSWLAKDRPDDMELKNESPQPPKKWDKEALAEWKRVVPILLNKGVLSRVDRAGLITMCEAWADYNILKAESLNHNMVSAEFKQLMVLADQAYKRWQQMAARFGLTPADRPRVKIPDGAGKGKGKERFFKPRIAKSG